jgi:uncharacterized phage-associated protein
VDLNKRIDLTDGPPYPSMAVANSILDIAEKKGQKLDPLKLQKLLYFAHGWHLAFFEKPLIDEEIQAWKYGPVIQTVYDAFKIFGADEIDGPSISYGDGTFAIFDIGSADTDRHNLFQEIWKAYGHLSGLELSALSHETDSPWYKVWNTNETKLRYLSISNEIIADYFKNQLKKS